MPPVPALRRLTPAPRPLPGQPGKYQAFKTGTSSSAFTPWELSLSLLQLLRNAFA